MEGRPLTLPAKRRGRDVQHKEKEGGGPREIGGKTVQFLQKESYVNFITQFIKGILSVLNLLNGGGLFLEGRGQVFTQGLLQLEKTTQLIILKREKEK